MKRESALCYTVSNPSMDERKAAHKVPVQSPSKGVAEDHPEAAVYQSFESKTRCRPGCETCSCCCMLKFKYDIDEILPITPAM